MRSICLFTSSCFAAFIGFVGCQSTSNKEVSPNGGQDGSGDAGAAGDTGDGGAAGVSDPGGAPGDGGAAGDGTPGPGRGGVIRTLVYHQVTLGENGGLDTTKGLAFSRDGSRALFDENIGVNYAPTAVAANGSGKVAIDSVSAGFINMTAVSGDGAWVAYTAGSLFFSTVASPARVEGPEVKLSQSWAKFGKDPSDPSKWRAYFFSGVAWGAVPHERGVYSVGTDGTSVMSLMTPAQAAAIIGGGIAESSLYPKYNEHGIDVSADGKEYVTVWAAGACTQTGEKDYILSAATNGSSSHLLAGPITDGCGVAKVGLSGDGTTVAFDIDDAGNTGKRTVVVVGFAGAGKKTIATFAGGDDNNWGISDDGKLILADYKLHNADGSGSFDLAVQGGSFSSDGPTGIDLDLGAPNGKLDRIAYADTTANPRRVGILDIDPTSTGAAPSLSAPTLSRASVPADGLTSATISVKVASSRTIERVGAAVLLAGAHDNLGFADVVLFDDGTHGDAVAGDGVYTDNELRADPDAKSGVRTIRARATVADESDKKHSTAIDFGPFAVD